MGKKGSWLSAIKRVFTPTSKDKPVNVVEKNKEKKQVRGKLKHGENRSFIPLFREPSSIEKILGEIDQQNFFIEQPTPPQPSFSGRPRVASPKAVQRPIIFSHDRLTYRAEPTLGHHNLSATRIQAAYRGYMARRSFRALRGLVRLQGVVRGQNVKRQTVNAMKQMQLLVRVQTQIQSRRIQMLDNQPKNDKEVDSPLGKWTFNNLSEMGDEHWDDSLITKEEREARLQRKMEAIRKRERAIAYAYSHQLWKATPKSAKNALTDIRSGGFPWWWNWLERQMPSDSQPTTTLTPTPPRRSPRPESSNGYKQKLQISSPRSTTTHLPTKTTPTRTPPLNMTKAKAKRSVASPYPTKDDDSLMSCPPFSVPNYMSPTLSAKAKLKPTTTTTSSNPPKETFSSTTTTPKRRFSFPLTHTFKWSKPKDSASKALDDHKSVKSPRSIGNFSIDSAISMPATVGRKPFNRFV